MIGKEILDHDSNVDVTENKFTEITVDRASIEDTKSFWNRVFESEKESISDDELWENMLYCEESEFVFDNALGKKTREILSCFTSNTWETVDVDERYNLIKQLASCIGTSLGLEILPDIELIELEDDCFGYYNERENYVAINTKYWDAPRDLVDTVAHEMRHAYQRYRADICENSQDELYRFNYDHYISTECDEHGNYVNFFDYYLQYIEVEARAYAKEFAKEVA